MSSAESAAETPRVVSVVPLIPAWGVDKAFDYSVPSKLEGKVSPGSLVRVPFGHRRVRAVVVGDGGDAPGDKDLQELISVVVDVPLVPPPMDRLFEWFALRYLVPRGQALARAVPPRVRMKVAEPEPLQPGPPQALLGSYVGGDRLAEAVSSGAGGTWSLRLLPGEDRAAVIRELLGHVARAGGAALVLVPEVRYGSGVLDGVAEGYPSMVRLDTAQPEPERAGGWVRLARGHALGSGGRSAVLAPAPGLNLLIVDKEHHPTYKEDRTPRYDARRVAIERARLQGATCVLMSATPPLETALAVQRGQFGGARPQRNASRSARPIVEVVPPPDNAIGPELHRGIREALRRGANAGLLVPLAGYSRSVWCSACARSLRCVRCEAGLVFDREGGLVRCTRCRWSSFPPDTCPTCGGSDFRFVGAGSERLQEQLARMFPQAPVVRVDPSVLSAGPFDRLEAGGGGIYVTTWIGTKSSLRPRVGLVGVIDADALIRRPGFRAAENAYSALQEMAEWAGPASAGGRLIVQTGEPGHHAVQAVVRADYDYFVERELEQRSELAYPPFSELVKVTASGPRGEELVTRAAAAVRPHAKATLGPISLGRPGAEPSFQILVKCVEAGAVAGALRGLVQERGAGARLSVDVDPR